MKTIIYLLLVVFIVGMLPLNQINANPYVRLIIEATDGNISEEVLKQSSVIMESRLNDAGISKFDINLEPGRIIIDLPGQYANEPVKNMLIAKGRFEFREPDTQRLILESKDIESMKLGQDQSNSIYAEIRFRKEVIPLWAAATKRNLNKSIAVVLDGRTIFDPVIREEIPGGNSIITGNFTLEELKYISALGNNGELPAEFRIVK